MDGVFSSTLRAVCTDEKRDQKWIILDGPVDTSWIESMNSLLDDNRVLTLNNGERIALAPQVSLLFEVSSLAAASPATVSRCGMVYFDVSDLGWRPFLDSWMLLRNNATEADVLRSLCEKYVVPALNFRKSARDTVYVTELGAIRALCSIYDAVATVENGVDERDTESYGRMVELWFLFALIWALGGPLNDESRKTCFCESSRANSPARIQCTSIMSISKIRLGLLGKKHFRITGDIRQILRSRVFLSRR
jgi:dynein heavy chain